MAAFENQSGPDLDLFVGQTWSDWQNAVESDTGMEIFVVLLGRCFWNVDESRCIFVKLKLLALLNPFTDFIFLLLQQESSQSVVEKSLLISCHCF